tara:strand:- start:1102 stop:1536 length:435 start_codon:yes stop_codon:yes gene_type:complete
MNYQDYHNDSTNKLIHFICIPLIVLTSANFLSKSKIKILGTGLYGLSLLILLLNYLINYGLVTFILMLSYYCIIDYYSEKWLKRNNWFIESVIIFILSWILQFIGHYIEGTRPALMDSITTAITQAPLFSIMYFFELIMYLIIT